MNRARLLFFLALGSTLALVPAAAFGAPPEVLHFKDIGPFVDPDFCGTGQTVNGSFNVRTNVWISSAGPEELVRSTASGKISFTNPANGRSFLLSFAGQTTDRVIEGEEGGVHTHEIVQRGLPEKIKAEGRGPVLVRDAGIIVFHITFDKNHNVIAFETVLIKGPHPEAESDFELFCEVGTAALGIA
jgi:hypothetical protein